MRNDQWSGERVFTRTFFSPSWIPVGKGKKHVFSYTVGVIVRLQLQFPSKGGECDCSSGDEGQRGVRGEQSGEFIM